MLHVRSSLVPLAAMCVGFFLLFWGGLSGYCCWDKAWPFNNKIQFVYVGTWPVTSGYLR